MDWMRERKQPLEIESIVAMEGVYTTPTHHHTLTRVTYSLPR